MTPTLPTRAARTGMSASDLLELAVGLDGGDDGLDRDAPVGDELPTGAASGRRERRRPDVLVDEHSCDAARLHGGRQVHDVLRGEQLGELRLQRLERSELLDVPQL